MFKNMKLGAKVMLGFCGLLALAMALGGMAVYRMKGVEVDAVKLSREYVPEAGLAGQLERRVYRTMYAIRGYGFTGVQKFYEDGREGMGQVKETLGSLDELAAGAADLTKLRDTLGEAKQSISEYEKLMGETQNSLNELEKTQHDMDARAKGFMDNASSFLKYQNEAMIKEITEGLELPKLKERSTKITMVSDIIALGNTARIANWHSQTLRQPQIMDEAVKTVFPAIKAKADELAAITRQTVNQDRITSIMTDAAGYQVAMQKVLTILKELDRLNTARMNHGSKALEISRNLATAASEHTRQIATQAESSLGSASTAMLFGLGAALAIGLTMAFFLTRSISGPIRRVISGLTEGAEQVASASTQVSSASQSLAEGASQQAAAIEETSSSLEEMSSMTRMNAENAQQANGLMGEARRVIETANGSMGQLTESMADISRASEETSKIIKTIDEIAFQTNLLALNAAVEAARAGEAGAGFAVVADEVRNLAMRAADAAKNTADLIEGTVKKVKDGSELMIRTNEAFQQVADSSAKVAELVGEISAASGEQAQGIDQINRAVSEMDKVIQQNAANAEESAAASEEMNAQAEIMKDMVGELVVMVGAVGRKEGRIGKSRSNAARTSDLESRSQRTTLLPAKQPRKGGNGKVHSPAPLIAGRKSNPSEIIPLDRDELADF
jgi:methyl-accepting chemotaxis protein